MFAIKLRHIDIVDVPGCADDDPLNSMVLSKIMDNDANIVGVLDDDTSYGTSLLKAQLKRYGSKFWEKLRDDPTNYKFCWMRYGERKTIPKTDKFLGDLRKEVYEHLNEQEEKSADFEAINTPIIKKHYYDILLGETPHPDKISAIDRAGAISSFDFSPVLFCSMVLNFSAVKRWVGIHGPEPVDRLRRWTNGARFLALTRINARQRQIVLLKKLLTNADSLLRRYKEPPSAALVTNTNPFESVPREVLEHIEDSCASYIKILRRRKLNSDTEVAIEKFLKLIVDGMGEIESSVGEVSERVDELLNARLRQSGIIKKELTGLMSGKTRLHVKKLLNPRNTREMDCELLLFNPGETSIEVDIARTIVTLTEKRLCEILTKVTEGLMEQLVEHLLNREHSNDDHEKVLEVLKNFAVSQFDPDRFHPSDSEIEIGPDYRLRDSISGLFTIYCRDAGMTSEARVAGIVKKWMPSARRYALQQFADHLEERKKSVKLPKLTTYSTINDRDVKLIVDMFEPVLSENFHAHILKLAKEYIKKQVSSFLSRIMQTNSNREQSMTTIGVGEERRTRKSVHRSKVFDTVALSVRFVQELSLSVTSRDEVAEEPCDEKAGPFKDVVTMIDSVLVPLQKMLDIIKRQVNDADQHDLLLGVEKMITLDSALLYADQAGFLERLYKAPRDGTLPSSKRKAARNFGYANPYGTSECHCSERRPLDTVVLKKKYGLCVYDVPGDGNCLFSALGHQLFGETSEDVADMLRGVMVHITLWLYDESEVPFEVASGGMTRSDWLDHMLSNGTWGDSFIL